jgi:hypothetical protein
MPSLAELLLSPPEPEAPEKVFAADFESSPAFNEMISEAFRRRMPNAETRQQYREDFVRFREFCTEQGVDALLATGPVVAAWLAGIAQEEARPLRRVCAVLSAIEHYRWLSRRDAFAEAVILGAASIEQAADPPEDDGGDDGGGKELDGKTEAAVETESLPLSAEAPQIDEGN